MAGPGISSHRIRCVDFAENLSESSGISHDQCIGHQSLICCLCILRKGEVLKIVDFLGNETVVLFNFVCIDIISR